MAPLISTHQILRVWFETSQVNFLIFQNKESMRSPRAQTIIFSFAGTAQIIIAMEFFSDSEFSGKSSRLLLISQ